MNKEDFYNNLKVINDCSFIRYILGGETTICLQVISIVELSEIEHDHIDNINGRLFKIVFHNISNLKISGEEADNYSLLESKIEKDYIYLKYHGNNYIGKNSILEISFNYKQYEVIDCGLISGPDA